MLAMARSPDSAYWHHMEYSCETANAGKELAEASYRKQLMNRAEPGCEGGDKPGDFLH
jgi:hypothetical protein